MDSVAEIKARLPIDELVRQYCQLQKKGRNFVCLCPFHNDSRPSFLVSPDKGIGYCFACNSGGDIFSFYQKIEGVDFPQALKELAEKAGIVLPERSEQSALPRDEKERMRAALDAAAQFYRVKLQSSPDVRGYLHKRGVTDAEIELFEVGMAPEGRSTLYDHLLKSGFSRSEITGAGLASQRDLQDAPALDRFHHRVMFPIRDLQGRMIGFGGRTLGNDDAKYLNSAETPLYRKSAVLYGIHQAKEAMRELKRAVIVEGYFDVLACRRVGVSEVVATCGTALTEEHGRLLKRYVDDAVLCMDQDPAGRAAADKAFVTLSSQGMAVLGATTGATKDPADAALEDADGLRTSLTTGACPYIDQVLATLSSDAMSSAAGKRAAMERLLPLLGALPTAVERSHYVSAVAAVIGSTESAVEEDLARFRSDDRPVRQAPAVVPPPSASLFAPAEIALGFLISSPRLLHLLPELIPPEEGMAAALYEALRQVDAAQPFSLDDLQVPEEYRERVRVLQLFCEQHGFHALSESLAVREARKNCKQANHVYLQKKMHEIASQLRLAGAEGRQGDRALLQSQFEQIQKLARMAGK
jgi:DNA primase